MHVVIVGGGFGGIKTALEMSKRQLGKVTLISDETYFFHYSSLYSTAMGRDADESMIPLQTIFEKSPNVELIHDRIVSFDPKKHLIGGRKKDYHYDKLVLTLGSTTDFKGVVGLKKHAYDTRSLRDIRDFQDHMHEEVVKKKLDKNYFIIGGGQTGVEIAGALNTYLKNLIDLSDLHTEASVSIVEADQRILPALSKTASDKSAHELEKQGVKILTNSRVESIDKDTITINGRGYSTTTAVWTSGIAYHPFFKRFDNFFRLADDGRVLVNPFLEALDDVYVIGDNNALKYERSALRAVDQAKLTAKNITRLATERPQLQYKPRKYAVGIPIGKNWGYVEYMGVYVAGWLGGVTRRLLELHGLNQVLPLKLALPIWRAHGLHRFDDF